MLGKAGSVRSIFVFCLWLTVSAGYSQEVKVIDKTTFKPVENAVIYDLDHERSSLTNKSGVASLAEFRPGDTLIFQHASYIPVILSYSRLSEEGFKLYLSARSVPLQEIVVAASKWEQKKEEVPNKIVGIQQKEIAFDNPQTSADLLGNTGEVFIQKSQQGGGSPMIRGFSANSVLIVVDGVRMNNAIYRSGNLQNVISIDPNSVENAEVVFGPGSVIYGSDAMGGVMDFHTFEPDLAYDGKKITRVNFLGRYASVNDEFTGHLDVNYGLKKWGFYTSFTRTSFGDLVMGSRNHPDYQRMEYAARINGVDVMLDNPNPDKQVHSGYDQFNFMQKIRFRPGDHIDMGYSFIYSTTSDIPRYDRLIQYGDNNVLRFAEWYYGPQEWMMHNFNLSFIRPSGIFDEGRIIAAYQNYKESRHDRRFGRETLYHQKESVDVFSLNIDFDKKINGKSELFYGIEGVFNDVVSQGSEEDIRTGASGPSATRYPDGKNHYLTGAAYVSYKRNLSAKTTLVTGLRYSQVSLKSTILDTANYNLPFGELTLNTGALNGSIGMTYRPTTAWQFNINASTGFRAPNLDDVAKVFDSEPGSVVVPNPDLKPEYAYNIDAGIIMKQGDIATVEVTGFYTILDDAIVRRDFKFNGQDSVLYQGETSKVQAMVNASGARLYGLSGSLYLDLSEEFDFRSNISWARGEDDDGYALRHVAPLFGSSSLIYTVKRFRAEIIAEYNGAIPFERLAPSERNKEYMYAPDQDGNPYSPSWWTLGFRSSLNLNENLVVDFRVDNIFDQRYRPYSSGITAGGRGIMFGFRGNF